MQGKHVGIGKYVQYRHKWVVQWSFKSDSPKNSPKTNFTLAALCVRVPFRAMSAAPSLSLLWEMSKEVFACIQWWVCTWFLWWNTVWTPITRGWSLLCIQRASCCHWTTIPWRWSSPLWSYDCVHQNERGCELCLEMSHVQCLFFRFLESLAAPWMWLASHILFDFAESPLERNHLIHRVVLLVPPAGTSLWIYQAMVWFSRVCPFFLSLVLSTCWPSVMMSTETGICCVTSHQQQGRTVCLAPSTFAFQPFVLGPSWGTCPSFSKFLFYLCLQTFHLFGDCTHLCWLLQTESCLQTQIVWSIPVVCAGNVHLLLEGDRKNLY